MAAPPPTYDLMLLLDPQAESGQRERIRADVRAAIEAAGTLVAARDFGPRTLAYEIRHGDRAEYDLLQFQGPPTLLEQLQRTLRITDGVVRFRIIKVRPGTPEAPDLRQLPGPEGAEPAAEAGAQAAPAS